MTYFGIFLFISISFVYHTFTNYFQISWRSMATTRNASHIHTTTHTRHHKKIELLRAHKWTIRTMNSIERFNFDDPWKWVKQFIWINKHSATYNSYLMKTYFQWIELAHKSYYEHLHSNTQQLFTNFSADTTVIIIIVNNCSYSI